MSRITRLSLILFLLPLSTFAGDAWKDKPYRNWSKKDVQRILSASPWAKSQLIQWFPYHSGTHIESAQTVTIIGKDDPRRADPTRDAMGTDAQSAVWQPKSVYTIRWASSRTIRRALVRQSVLRGGAASATQEDSLDREADEYTVTISSLSLLSDWPEVDAADWQANAYLQAKGSGRKVLPARVEIRRGIQQSDGSSVVFHFPRNLPDGEPFIGPAESSVEFFTQVGPRVFSVKFIPADMVARDGRDL